MQLRNLSVLGLTYWFISHYGPSTSVSAFSLRPVYFSHRPVWATRIADVEDPHFTAERLFESAEFLEVVLSEHKPLGCTVEESLASAVIELGDNTEMKLDYVFLSAVKAGGNAEKAGLMVGDVVVGVTGIFGELENVVGLGIDKV
jgi:predicted metalloprotease with PDZ domain